MNPQGPRGLKAVASLLWLTFLSLVLVGCSTGNDPELTSGMRGAWVQASSINTPEEVDAMLTRAEAGGLDALFVNALAYGHTWWDSELLQKHPSVAADYDPLAYVIEQAHQRGIAVHTWLVAGPVSFRGKPAPVFVEHPEWLMVGPDGRQTSWLNYTRPDVRQFISDLVMEIITDYDIDGVHFDYTRYPGPEWGFDPYSAELVAEEYGLDLEQLRYARLPAYATFEGNPLISAATAQVLAKFDNGLPAVLLNQYGAGQVIVLNWSASERQVAASSEILDRSIDYLLGESGQVYVLRSETNATRYSSELFEEGVEWLEELGWQPILATEAELPILNPDGVLVLPQVYLIGAQTAVDLAGFVQQGGGVIFVDGPTPSMGDENVRRVTGMRLRGLYFKREGLLIATQEHDIIPAGGQPLSLEQCEALDAEWKAFRARGINNLLQDVYQRVKQQAPDVVVSITVAADQEVLAERHLLDWQTWLEEGYVDLVIPRAYVTEDEWLAPVLANWQRAMEDSERIALGLKTFTAQDDAAIPKTPHRVLDEITMAYGQGSQGIVLFDLGNTSDAVLEALGNSAWQTLGATAE
jgi:uncharacterized lipoprotein YddW (UPF0748 family)